MPSHKQKHFQHQIIALGVGILLVVIYLAVFGLNSVINFSVWVGNTISGNAQRQTSERKEDFFGTIFVDDLPVATNSAEIVVTGSTSNFDTLKFEINGNTAKTVKVLDQESFSETIGKLKPGENKIQIVAESKEFKEKKESETYTVVYKNTPPKLTVSEPANDSTVKARTPEVTIKGETDKGVTVEIDGAPAVVTANGSFQSTVRLKEGDNTITILAIDEAGNEQKQEIKVKYEKDE